MSVTLIGRKMGMMRLYDGAGRVRGVSVIEVAPNRVTQLRTSDRDGYEAVQLGTHGNRKRLNRPQRGHLRAAGLEGQVLDVQRETRVATTEGFALGQSLGVEQFTPGQFVNVTGVSKGRGFAGGVRRWNFRGGPKTHGQSDRHRAPGSIGAGTTPGRVFKGLKMAGHMGARRTMVMNLLVVLVDPDRHLVFVEGSVPGPRGGIVEIAAGRRPSIEGYAPAVIPAADIPAALPDEIEEPVAEDADDAPEGADAPEAGEAGDGAEEGEAAR